MAMEMAKSVAAIKSAVYSVQLSLLDGISDMQKLQAAGKVLTQSDYADVVTERSIINTCGYPLCPKPLPSTFPRKGRYRISLREHKVYDLEETRLFCCSDCLAASKTFAALLAAERDFSSKVLELVAAFHNGGIQDVGEQHVAGPSASKKGSVLIQELDEQCYEDALAPVELPVSAETMAKELDPGTFLLIREQNESRVTDFSTAGPFNAIDGYIPQKEFPASRQKQETEKQHKQNSTDSPRKDAKELSANSARKKGSKEMAAFAGYSKKPLRRASFDKKADFTSCILVDQGDRTSLSNSKSKINSESSCNESGKSHASHLVVHEEASTQKSGQLRSRKHNRVSWADHHNQNLVEELSHSTTTTGCKDLTDTRKVLQGEKDWGIMSDSLTSNEDASNVNAGISLLQKQERFCVSECDKTQCTTREECDYVSSHEEATTSKEVDVFVRDCSAMPEREDRNGCKDSANESLECVKALVAALTDVAEAVACGELDSSEAVARAGISILPKADVPANHHVKEGNDLDNEEEADVEDVDPRNCWYSAPPKGFKPELSAFGTLLMALDGWISAASIAYVYGRDTNEQEVFTVVNGKEYSRQVIVPNGASAEIERTLAGCISRALPRLVEILRLPVPVSTLEVSVGRLLRTMSFTTAIPAFSSKQWQVVALLLLDGLSVHRLPALRPRFQNGRQSIHKVLASANISETEYDIFRDLVLPMGMLPQFVAHCGG